jgi:hypothetical protein
MMHAIGNNTEPERKYYAATILGKLEEFNRNPELQTDHGEIFDYCLHVIEHLTPICLASGKEQAETLFAQMLQVLEYIIEHDTEDHAKWIELTTLLDYLARQQVQNQYLVNNNKTDNKTLFYITINSLCETDNIREKILAWFSRNEMQKFTQSYFDYTALIYKDIKFDIVTIYEFLQDIKPPSNNYREQLSDILEQLNDIIESTEAGSAHLLPSLLIAKLIQPC